MSTVITMPQQGLTEESSVIAEWYVKEGDTVTAGQCVMEADLDQIRHAGLSPIVITVLCS